MMVERGAVTGLIGPNGAGKTTLFNVVCGPARPPGRPGRARRARRHAPPAAPAGPLGLARTFQRLELFTSLTVRDNVRVAGDIHNRWSRGRRDSAAEAEKMPSTHRPPGARGPRGGRPPTGQARVVELARALMTRPTTLLLDEPAAGQTERRPRRSAHLLRRLADDGLAICLVEHDMSLVMDVCETIQVLDYGRTIAIGPPEGATTRP